MNKTELDSKVYSEYDEQFQIFAWIALFLLIADFMTWIVRTVYLGK